jgi:hypothetical protein
MAFYTTLKVKCDKSFLRLFTQVAHPGFIEWYYPHLAICSLPVLEAQYFSGITGNLFTNSITLPRKEKMSYLHYIRLIPR